MFGKMKNMMGQMQMMQKLMKDENFKAFMMHPKIQELLKDPEFLEAMKNQDTTTLMNNPKFSALRQDPELAKLAAKMNFKP